ncbi:MAG: T9SS type A sorting domain-containing protein [Saprospiraceae bacterium]
MKKGFFTLLISLTYLSLALAQDCRVEIVKASATNSIVLELNLKPTDQVRQISWSTGDSTARIEVRQGGTYCVKVLFSNGCRADDCISVDGLSNSCQVEIKREVTNAGLKLIAVPRPEDAVAAIKWSTGEEGRAILVKEPGKYCVGVRFTTGCTAEECVEVPGRDCSVSFERIQVDAGLLVNILPQPDTGIVAVKWSTGDTTRQILVTTPGKYCVRIAYRNGCVAENCFHLDEPCSAHIRMARGKLGAKARGIAPFTYLWSTGDSSEIIEVKEQGEYCLTITDATGCLSSTCVKYYPEVLQALSWDATVNSPEKVTNNHPGSLTPAETSAGITLIPDPIVFPNPSSGMWNIQLTINQSGIFIVQIQDMQGKLHVKKSIALSEGEQVIPIDGSSLPPGYYITTIRSNTRNWALKTIKR